MTTPEAMTDATTEDLLEHGRRMVEAEPAADEIGAVWLFFSDSGPCGHSNPDITAQTGRAFLEKILPGLASDARAQSCVVAVPERDEPKTLAVIAITPRAIQAKSLGVKAGDGRTQVIELPGTVAGELLAAADAVRKALTST